MEGSVCGISYSSDFPDLQNYFGPQNWDFPFKYDLTSLAAFSLKDFSEKKSDIGGR